MSLNLRMGELEDYKKHIKEDMVMQFIISLCERGVCFVHCAHFRIETHVEGGVQISIGQKLIKCTKNLFSYF